MPLQFDCKPLQSGDLPLARRMVPESGDRQTWGVWRVSANGRDGVSEYFLNGAAMRLKDIIDFFERRITQK